jgi:hypothetical protein
MTSRCGAQTNSYCEKIWLTCDLRQRITNFLFASFITPTIITVYMFGMELPQMEIVLICGIVLLFFVMRSCGCWKIEELCFVPIRTIVYTWCMTNLSGMGHEFACGG